MPSGTENILLIATVRELIAGTLGNGFIILVNCIDRVKGQKLSSVDCILSLALSRITLLWLTVSDSFVLVLWPHLYATEKLTNCIFIFWTLLNYLAAWLATSLSIFYFFRIANFSHPCFACLRWRISKVLLVLPLASFSLFFNFESIHALTYFWVNLYKSHEKNSTWFLDVSKTLYVKSMIVYNFIYLIPFLLSLTSLLLLFVSLIRHSRNVQINSSSRDFSTETHKKAMKMVLSFLLLLLTFHFSSFVLTRWCFLTENKQQVHLSITLISAIFLLGHLFILILGNSKLR